MWIYLIPMILPAAPPNLDETNPLDTSCDHLLHLDSPSLSSELQDTSSVDSVEIEFLSESERQEDHTNLSQTDVSSGDHDYELFLLQQEIDAPNGNLNHQDTHNKQDFIQLQKSFWSSTHVNSCSNYTLHITTYFIDCFIQGVIKNPKSRKSMKYSKSYTQNKLKLFGTTSCYITLHLNLKRLGFTGEPITQWTCQSHVK